MLYDTNSRDLWMSNLADIWGKIEYRCQSIALLYYQTRTEHRTVNVTLLLMPDIHQYSIQKADRQMQTISSVRGNEVLVG